MSRFNTFTFNFDNKTKMLLKISLITVGTVYGGHKLVQFVSPTKEELLEVYQSEMILNY